MLHVVAGVPVAWEQALVHLMVYSSRNSGPSGPEFSVTFACSKKETAIVEVGDFPHFLLEAEQPSVRVAEGGPAGLEGYHEGDG